MLWCHQFHALSQWPPANLLRSTIRVHPETPEPGKLGFRLRVTTLRQHLVANLEKLCAQTSAERLKARYAKFRAHGRFLEKQPDAA